MSESGRPHSYVINLANPLDWFCWCGGVFARLRYRDDYTIMMTSIYPGSDIWWQRLKRAMIYSIALGLIFFPVENAEFVMAKCITISTALGCSRNYVRRECLSHIHWFPLGLSLLLIWFRLKKRLPSFEVLAASCLDNALPSIPLIVLHNLARSVFWSMFSTKYLNFCSLCAQIRFWMSLFSVWSSGEVGSLLRRSLHLVISSSISDSTGFSWSLCRPVGMWCDAALSRIVRRTFSSLW